MQIELKASASSSTDFFDSILFPGDCNCCEPDCHASCTSDKSTCCDFSTYTFSLPPVSIDDLIAFVQQQTDRTAAKRKQRDLEDGRMTDSPSDAVFKRPMLPVAAGTGDSSSSNSSERRFHANANAKANANANAGPTPTNIASNIAATNVVSMLNPAVDTDAELRQSGAVADLSAASFLYPSPLETAADSFSSFDLALASVALGSTTPYTNFLMPSPAAPAMPASVPFDAIDASPFVGTMPDPAFSNVGNLLFDDFDFDTGIGGDFALFEDVSPSAASQATPSVQNLSTPFLPMAGTPLIPLHATPFVPALSFFPDQQKVSISMEDLTTLLQLANSCGNVPAKPETSPSSSAAVSAEAETSGLRHATGRVARRRTTRLYTCSIDGCGKQFSRNFNLKTHELTHEADRARDFVCSEPGCGKTFVRVHDLNRHFATHDQSRWHFCSGCNRGFARIDALRRHERTGSGACKKV